MKRFSVFLLLGMFFLVYGTIASAGVFTSTICVDNYYVLAYGNADGSNLHVVGDSLTVRWYPPETFTFDTGDAQYIYVAAWGDGSTAQGFLGQFVSESQTILTNLNDWEVFSTYKPYTNSIGLASDISSAVWHPIQYKMDNSDVAWWWGIVTQISTIAKWIWPLPLRPGSSIGEYHIFRTAVLPTPPAASITAEAGPDVTLYSDQEPVSTILGSATYNSFRPLTYRWRDAQNVLLDWTPVSYNLDCPLNLDSLSLSLGTVILILDVSDGVVSASDTMMLTVNNSAPHAAILGGGGTYETGASPILSAQASDFDGDRLNFSWEEGSSIICSGSINSVYGGEPVQIPDCTANNLSLGSHTITLVVDDGLSSPVTDQLIVNVTDSTAPSIAPYTETGILWPPNHKMISVVIYANAHDNSGMPVTLSASVTSNEPEDGLGDGDTSPDWTTPVINQETGAISLLLRSERSGSGSGRVYTITIYATDYSNNQSSAEVKIIVPHDKGKN